MRLTISMRGAELVRTGLEDLAGEVPKIGRDQIFRALTKAKERIQTYPPERPGQRYVRTYRLQRGWYIRTSDISGYKFGNEVSYTSRVVGNAYGQGQAEPFVGRWLLVRDVVGQETSRLRQEIQDHIYMVARRNNLAS